jgi:hypothetical protein
MGYPKKENLESSGENSLSNKYGIPPDFLPGLGLDLWGIFGFGVTAGVAAMLSTFWLSYGLFKEMLDACSPTPEKTTALLLSYGIKEEHINTEDAAYAKRLLEAEKSSFKIQKKTPDLSSEEIHKKRARGWLDRIGLSDMPLDPNQPDVMQILEDAKSQTHIQKKTPAPSAPTSEKDGEQGTFIDDLFAPVLESFGELIPFARQSGFAFFETFCGGVEKEKDEMDSAAEDVMGEAAAPLPHSDAKRGPLSNLSKLGGQMFRTAGRQSKRPFGLSPGFGVPMAQESSSMGQGGGTNFGAREISLDQVIFDLETVPERPEAVSQALNRMAQEVGQAIAGATASPIAK